MFFLGLGRQRIRVDPFGHLLKRVVGRRILGRAQPREIALGDGSRVEVRG